MAAKVFKRAQVAKIAESLNALVPKQDDELSAREAVALIALEVRRALARGISLATVAQRFGLSERYLRGTLKALESEEEAPALGEKDDVPFTELARLEPTPVDPDTD